MLCKKLFAYTSCRLLALTGLLLLSDAHVYGQIIGPTAIDAAGTSVTAGGITYEYAIGQFLADSTFTSNLLIVTPGVLQPVNTTGISPSAILPAQLQVYPDPVQTMLFIQPAFSSGGKLIYGLYDAAGKQVLRQEAILKTGGERQALNVSHIVAGQYILQVTWLSAGTTSAVGYKVQKLQ